jgi:peptide-methionine (S)-S-oxide reductase
MKLEIPSLGLVHWRYPQGGLCREPKRRTCRSRKATFAGGCFWCMEPPYDKLDGVISTISGYAGGKTKNPTYDEVSRGTTGHTEVVQLTYDPKKITYEKLLDVFWRNIDPLAANRQFCDVGSQYRSAIFYHDENQKRLAEESKKALSKRFKEPIVTELSPIPILSGGGLSPGLLREKPAPL